MLCAYRGLLYMYPAAYRREFGDEMREVAVFPGDRLPELAFSSHREAMSDWLACREQSRMEAT